MNLQGEQLIPATKEKVWEALNDPTVLQECIPGCQSLEKTGDDGFDATVSMKVGPVKAKFSGSVTLSNIDAPNSYTISGEGKGGAAGFAKGGADVSLEEADGGTLLKYNVEAKVGGKLAQIGSRLVDGTAKKLAEEFFQKFGELVSQVDATDGDDETETAETSIDTPAASDQSDDLHKQQGLSPMVWTIGLVAIAAVLLFAFAQ